MATTDAPSVNIVHKVLSQDTYELWSFRVKTYLEAEDLWSVVKPTTEPPKLEDDEVRFNIWSKKNAKALHAIHICCGDDLFPIVKGLDKAKDAWDKLETKFKSNTYQIIPHIPVIGGNADDDILDEMQKIYMKEKLDDQGGESYIEDAGESFLEKSFLEDIRPKAREYGGVLNAMFIAHVESGDHLDAIKTYLVSNPQILKEARSSSTGKTALHIAVEAENVLVVEELLNFMSSKEDLEERDINGMTALVTAATVGNINIAKLLIHKNEGLVTIKCLPDATLPLLVACKTGKWDLAGYLYSVTPLDELTKEEEGRQGAQLISLSIYSQEEFDIALDLIQKCPTLTFAKDYSENSPLYVLATMRSTCMTVPQLEPWQKLIYHNSGCFRGLRENLRHLLGINHIRKKRLVHVHTLKMLDFMCEATQQLTLKEMQEGTVLRAMLQAVEHGNVVFVRRMCETNANLIGIVDGKKKSLFQFSIECRQAEIYCLFFSLMSDDQRELIGSEADKFGNSILHSAGCLSSTAITQLDNIQGAALQLQRELQWFKEVESIVPHKIHVMVNDKDHMTASELFTKNHKEMAKEGEKQMKDIANSCTVVAALIVTMMFAAAFEVSRGTSGDKKWSRIFIISDSISLFSSTTSIVIFLGILTSRYSEDDFFKSLPRKMIIGLSTLFLSIAAMMIAFVFALIVKLHEAKWIIILVGSLATIPIVSFAWLQFPLLKTWISTFGKGRFHKKVGKGRFHKKVVSAYHSSGANIKMM